ncbi:hypothetical protein SBF1_6680002 [Candidatus Desulfosporosinus infrequens]|uniref:Uncharacterized protein n=1 Tax=Candidatus Desulfosporosinus infrequens TaxID=2043169 RepID=A0A2U3LNF1_9FIRM|nr:hypothetical protein SBF1_6680002 [Candidatus Desulfosporosinus infrequens]
MSRCSASLFAIISLTYSLRKVHEWVTNIDYNKYNNPRSHPTTLPSEGIFSLDLRHIRENNQGVFDLLFSFVCLILTCVCKEISTSVLN